MVYFRILSNIKQILIKMTYSKLNKQLNVRLDDDLFETLTRVVRLRRTTQSQYIRDALLSYLKKKDIPVMSDEKYETHADRS